MAINLVSRISRAQAIVDHQMNLYRYDLERFSVGTMGRALRLRNVYQHQLADIQGF